MNLLKQSTAATIKLGPFVDSTDGATAETGLTINASDVLLSKAGAALTAKNEATAPSHDANGYYAIALDATDTATLGLLKVAVSIAGALPAWDDFMVVAAEAYDAIVGGQPIPADVQEWLGSTAPDLGVPDGASFSEDWAAIKTSADAAAAAAAAIPTNPVLATDARLDNLDAKVSDVKAKTDTIPLDPAAVSDLPSEPLSAAQTETAVTNALNAYDPPTRAEATADKNAVIEAIPAAAPSASDNATAVWGAVARTLTDKAGFSLSAAGVTAIAAGVWGALTDGLTTVGSIGKWIIDRVDVVLSTRLASASYTAPPTVGQIADGVLEEATADHTTAGSVGKALIDTKADTTELLTRVPDATPGTEGGSPVVDADGNVAATLSAEQQAAIATAISDAIVVPPADVDEAAIAAAILDAVLTGHTTPSSLAVVVNTIATQIVSVYGAGTTLKVFSSTNAAGAALPGVLVKCYTDAALDDAHEWGASQVSDAEGKTRWLCNPGDTYYFVQQAAGYTFAVETEVA